MADKTLVRRVTYSVPEAADMLGMGRSTLYRLVKHKQVPHRVLPTGIKCFTQADIDEIIADSYRPAVA